MIEEPLKALAEKYNGTYTENDVMYRGPNFSRAPVTKYRLDFSHDDTHIKSRFEFGNTNMAEISIEVPLLRNFPNFSVERANHFLQLFKRKKQTWLIACEDERVKQNMLDLFQSSGLNDIAQKTLFEPEIVGRREEPHYRIEIRYSLSFEDKEKSILPIFQWAIELADTMR